MKDSTKNEALANMFAPYTSELLCNSHLILHVGLPVLALRCQGRVAPKLSLNKGMEALQKICKPAPEFNKHCLTYLCPIFGCCQGSLRTGDSVLTVNEQLQAF